MDEKIILEYVKKNSDSEYAAICKKNQNDSKLDESFENLKKDLELLNKLKRLLDYNTLFRVFDYDIAVKIKNYLENGLNG